MVRIYLFLLLVIPSLIAANHNITDHEQDRGTQSKDGLDDRLLIDVSPQNLQERVIEATLRDFNTLPIDQEEAFLYQPIAIDVVPNGDLYVLDYGDHFVKRYTQDGTLVNRYGHGQGAGPGETRNPTDVAVASGSGGVWINDQQGRKVEFFDAEGDHISAVRTDHGAWRIAALQNGRVNAAFGAHAEHMVSIADLQATEFLQTSPPVIEEQQYNVKVLEGETAAAGGHVIHVPHYGGLIFSYSLSDSKYSYVREQVNPPSLPFMQRTGDGDTGSIGLPYRDLNYRNLSVHADDESIYILVYRQTDESVDYFIDKYELDNGEYEYSYKLEKGFRDFAISEESFFLIDGENLYYSSDEL